MSTSGTSSSAPTPRQSLTATDWAQAALDALAQRGVDAVAVEPLAQKLGVTKGSFYWHFQNRNALLKAALDLWEQRETNDAIAAVHGENDPYQRIVKLFKMGSTGSYSARIYAALAAASDDPVVGTTLRKISARRLEFLEDCYRALGLNTEQARLWSTFAYSTYIGNQQVHRDAPDRFPGGEAFREYFRLMTATLIPHGTVVQDFPA